MNNRNAQTGEKNEAFNIWAFAILVILMAGTLYGALCLWMYLDKPLFVNKFGYFEKTGAIPVWSVHRSDLRDSAGNRFIADFRTNLFVVIEIGTERRPPVVSKAGDTAEIILTSGERIQIEVQTNQLIRIQSKGTIVTTPLPSNRAEQLYRLVEVSPPSERMKVVEGK